MTVKNQLFILLDHYQTLLQSYRSLTVMFQTFLLAVTTLILIALKDKTAIFFVCLLFSYFGLHVTFSLKRTCSIRAQYVDFIQNTIYSLEAHEIEIDDEFPIFSFLRRIQKTSNINHGNTVYSVTIEKMNRIMEKSKRDANKIGRGWTRFTLSHLFQYTFAFAWAAVFMYGTIQYFSGT